MAVMFGGMTLSLLWWLVADALWSLILFALVFGLCYGGFVALSPAITADYFGRRSVSSIIGFLYTGVAFGTLLGPTLAGVVFDLAHSYAIPIIGSAMAMVCMLIVPPPKNLKNL
jgi:MFS family permease